MYNIYTVSIIFILASTLALGVHVYHYLRSYLIVNIHDMHVRKLCGKDKSKQMVTSSRKPSLICVELSILNASTHNRVLIREASKCGNAKYKHSFTFIHLCLWGLWANKVVDTHIRYAHSSWCMYAYILASTCCMQ